MPPLEVGVKLEVVVLAPGVGVEVEVEEVEAGVVAAVQVPGPCLTASEGTS